MEDLLNIINRGLEEYIHSLETTQTAEQQTYMMSLGGKRIRPILTLLSHQLYHDNVQDSVPAAIAIEVFHNFTLVHDDIMDMAPIRRGKETVYQKWNTPTAILTGDVMMINAYQLLNKLPDTCRHEAFQIFSQTAVEVCDGQMMDMAFEKKDTVTIEEYIKMIQLKTAVLLGCSLKLGALTANAPKNDLDLLYQIGVHLGTAFQLQDDIMDVYSESADFGKQVAGDILSNKKTFLLISLVEAANTEDLKLLNEWLNYNQPKPEEKIAVVKNLYRKYGIREKAEVSMREYYEKAIQMIEQLEVPVDKKAALLNLSDQLLKRAN